MARTTGSIRLGGRARKRAGLHDPGLAETTVTEAKPTDDDLFHAIGVPQTGDKVPASDLGRFTDVAPLLTSPFNTNGDFSDNKTTGKLTGEAQSPAMMGAFRTPGLRNLTTSAPYMHSGQLATLEAVVDFYDTGTGSVPDGGTLAHAGGQPGARHQDTAGRTAAGGSRGVAGSGRRRAAAALDDVAKPPVSRHPTGARRPPGTGHAGG